MLLASYWFGDPTNFTSDPETSIYDTFHGIKCK